MKWFMFLLLLIIDVSAFDLIKTNWDDTEVSYLYSLLPFAAPRTRTTREVNGIGSKLPLPLIGEALKGTCEHNKELDESIQQFHTCTKSKTMFIASRDEFVENMRECSTKIKELLSQCLPQKLLYFPEFIFTLAESVTKLLYDDSEEISKGLIPCIPQMRNKTSQEGYIKCIKKATGNSNKIPGSKLIFCEKFIPVSECYVKQIFNTCTSNPELEKFSKDYMKAMKEPCSQEQIN